MRTRKGQTGASALGLLIGVSLLVAAISLTLKLGPHYIDWQTMKSVFDSLPKESVHKMSKDDIREMLAKRFRVNNLREFDIKEIVDIDRKKKDMTVITVSYERREPIVGNVDVVLSFSERYEYK